MSQYRVLPSGWIWATVADIGDPAPQIVTTGPFGTSVGRRDFVDAGVPVLTIGCLQKDGIAIDRAVYVKEEKAEELERYALRSGDLLFSRMASIGRVGLVSPSFAGALFNYHIMRLRLRSDIFLARLFVWWARGGPEVSAYLRDVNHGATRDGINTEQLLCLPVPVPPFSEQKRIVAVIEQYMSDIDAGVVALERALRNIQRHRASVLKAACEGKLVPTEAELARREGREYEPASVLLERILAERRQRWAATQKTKYKAPAEPSEIAKLPTLPEGWTWTTIESVGDVLLGRQRAPQYLTGKWSRPYLRVANVKDDRIDFADIETMDFDPEHFDRYRLAPGDILVSEGQSPDRVGESAIYAGGVEGLCFQKTLHRFRPVPSGPSSKFAQMVFRTHVKTGLFRKMASITTNIAHLTLEKFEAAPFPLPPLAEQHRIVAEVDRLLSVADETEATIRAQLRRAEQLRQSVLKRAFEGKLVAQDPADEPASAMLERLRADQRSTVPNGASKPRGRVRARIGARTEGEGERSDG